MQNELPEWAKLCADEIIGDYLDLSETRSGQLSRLVAKSLVAAERRGIGRAADIAEGFDGGAGTNPWGWPDRIAASIRQLGGEG